MDAERKSETPETETERPLPPAALLTAADTTRELAAAYAEWLRDQARSRP